jgi:hypothetical protein
MRRLVPIVALTLASAGVQAGVISDTSWDGAGKDLQSLFNGWVGPGYDVDSSYQTPDYWTIGATGTSAATFIIEIAGNASYNTFGLFDRNDTDNRLEVYNGGASSGAKRAITYNPLTDEYAVGDLLTWTLVDSATFSGSSFGFYLDGPGGTFFSAAELNGGNEQMVAFQGDGRTSNFMGTGNAPWLSNEWVLAWEDLPYGGSDQDFNDLVLIMESVTPVPEPGTLSLLGAGLLGLIVLRQRIHG